MNRIITILLTLFAVFISAQGQNVASLVVTHAGGITTSYELFTKPCVTFVGDSVKIASPTVSAEYLSKDDITTIVSRDLIVPAKVGMRLYDSNGSLLNDQSVSSTSNSYKDEKYTTQFTGLQENKEYTAHPTVAIFGYTMEATPTLKFKAKESVSATTGAASNITITGATIAGSAIGASTAKNTVSIGIVYNTFGSSSMNNDIKVASGNTANGDFSVTLSGLTENTTYYYYSYIAIDGTYYYGSILSFTTNKKLGDLTPGDVIDLGLSVKWASHNIGAAAPEGYGNYYAWGETAPKSDYSSSTSKWWGVSYSSLQSQGVIDSNGNLTATYDAATQNLGGSWRMPTKSEINELITKCTWTWTTYNGVNGRMVVGPNGNSIFLPAAGNRYNSNLNNAGKYGCYWNSTTLGDFNLSCNLSFYSDFYCLINILRCLGYPVRPVSE